MIPRKHLVIGKEEIILLKEQGLYQHIQSWKPGFLYLTNKRLVFAQGYNVVFERNLRGLIDIEIAKRRCILGKRIKQLSLLFDKRSYIAIREPEKWKDEIVQACFQNLPVISVKIAQVGGANGTDKNQCNTC